MRGQVVSRLLLSSADARIRAAVEIDNTPVLHTVKT